MPLFDEMRRRIVDAFSKNDGIKERPSVVLDELEKNAARLNAAERSRAMEHIKAYSNMYHLGRHNEPIPQDVRERIQTLDKRMGRLNTVDESRAVVERLGGPPSRAKVLEAVERSQKDLGLNHHRAFAVSQPALAEETVIERSPQAIGVGIGIGGRKRGHALSQAEEGKANYQLAAVHSIAQLEGDFEKNAALLEKTHAKIAAANPKLSPNDSWQIAENMVATKIETGEWPKNAVSDEERNRKARNAAIDALTHKFGDENFNLSHGDLKLLEETQQKVAVKNPGLSPKDSWDTAESMVTTKLKTGEWPKNDEERATGRKIKSAEKASAQSVGMGLTP
jgi:PBP1b-binding outer membrane lipoprotein LpoB